MLKRTKPEKSKYGRLVCVTGKTGFKSEQAALDRLEEHAEQGGNRHRKTIRAYQCDACPWWHLTSKEKR